MIVLITDKLSHVKELRTLNWTNCMDTGTQNGSDKHAGQALMYTRLFVGIGRRASWVVCMPR
jgi:hypothetical protein